MRWILNPKSYLLQTKMPNFRFTENEANAVRAYLLDASELAKGEPKPQRITERSLDARWIQEGETIFRMARCISCHLVDGKGGTIAPDLVNITTKVQLDWLFDWIKNPRAYQPNTKMPHYRFTDQEILKIITYLNSLKTSEISSDDENFAYSSGEVKRGEKLVIEYGCLGCHDRWDKGCWWESRCWPDFSVTSQLRILTLEMWQIFPHKGSWFSQTSNPECLQLRIAQKMPDYGFGIKEARAFSTVLLGFTEEHPPELFILKRQPESSYIPPGEFGKLVADLNCLTCHKINGRGGTRAWPSWGSRTNAAWLKKFLSNPTTLRPTLVDRMPKFNLTDKEIDIIINYMRTTLVNEKVTSEFLSGEKFSMPEIEQGRKLYHESIAASRVIKSTTKGERWDWVSLNRYEYPWEENSGVDLPVDQNPKARPNHTGTCHGFVWWSTVHSEISFELLMKNFQLSISDIRFWISLWVTALLTHVVVIGVCDEKKNVNLSIIESESARRDYRWETLSTILLWMSRNYSWRRWTAQLHAKSSSS